MGLTENQFGILLNLNDGEKRFSDLAKKVKKASLAKELKFLTKADMLREGLQILRHLQRTIE
jgi:DNA-binding HxlR family transcriptional regulator